MKGEKLLNICGTHILKSRIVGWKQSDDENHNYCMDIILDSGNSLKVIVQPWIYARQRESLEWAEEQYERLEKFLKEEFEVEPPSK